jgi:hypothetical protein
MQTLTFDLSLRRCTRAWNVQLLGQGSPSRAAEGMAGEGLAGAVTAVLRVRHHGSQFAAKHMSKPTKSHSKACILMLLHIQLS